MCRKNQQNEFSFKTKYENERKKQQNTEKRRLWRFFPLSKYKINMKNLFKKVYEATAHQPVSKASHFGSLRALPLSENFVVTSCAALEFKCMRDFFLFIFCNVYVLHCAWCEGSFHTYSVLRGNLIYRSL